MSEFLTDAQQRDLLGLARESITAHLGAGGPSRPRTVDGALLEKRGVFVTLKERGELRGCIGYPLPHKPLAAAVAEMAVAAAASDPRFSPVRLGELESVEIEISVLSVPRPVANPEEVVVGRHGLIVSKGFHKGLLLPQVPGEYGWDRETFLDHACLKAGLPSDAWRKGARLEVFEAQVFHESRLKGER
jgi:AmmeMemoRadiSam system protein A